MFHTINHQIHCIVYLPNLTKRSPGESSVFICSNSIRLEERRSSSQHHNIGYNRKYPVRYHWDITEISVSQLEEEVDHLNYDVINRRLLPLFWLVSSVPVGRWYTDGSWIIKVSFIQRPGGRRDSLWRREQNTWRREGMRWEDNQLFLDIFHCCLSYCWTAGTATLLMFIRQ